MRGTKAQRKAQRHKDTEVQRHRSTLIAVLLFTVYCLLFTVSFAACPSTDVCSKTNCFRPFTSTTGGGVGALDNMSYECLKNGDGANITISANETCFYRYDTSSSSAESGSGCDATVVKPDDNSGNGRWIRSTLKPGGGSPGGSGTELQYRNSGILGAIENSNWNAATQELTLEGRLGISDSLNNVIICKQGIDDVCGENITTGFGNILIGKNTAWYLTTGYYNTIIGWLGAENLSTGSWNVQLTNFSGISTSTGNGNTVLGGHASVEDGSFNTVMGFEAWMPHSYNEARYFVGTYNTLLGSETGVGGSTDQWSGKIDHSTIVGYGATIGGASKWMPAENIGNDGDSPNHIRITSIAHGLNNGQFVTFLGAEPHWQFNYNGTACILSEGAQFYFKIKDATTDSFDLEWCHAANGGDGRGGNWVNENCTAWFEANSSASYTADNIIYNFSSCDVSYGLNNVDGIFFQRVSSSTVTRNFATAVGALTNADCDNCVVLGRQEDTVYVPGNQTVTGILTGMPTGTIDLGTKSICSAWATIVDPIFCVGNLNRNGSGNESTMAGTAYAFALNYITSTDITQEGSAGALLYPPSLLSTSCENVGTGTDTITFYSPHNLAIGDMVMPEATIANCNVIRNTQYYICNTTSTTIVIDDNANCLSPVEMTGSSFDFAWVKDGVSYYNTADNDAFSFGNGSTDSAFSVMAYIKVPDVNASGQSNAAIISKLGITGQREWVVKLNSNEKLILSLQDDSTAAICEKTLDTALTIGNSYIVAATYNGNTESTGIKLYINGVEAAATGTADCAFLEYTAMENTAAALTIGSALTNSPSTFAGGKVGTVMLDNIEWTASEVLKLYNTSKMFYGL